MMLTKKITLFDGKPTIREEFYQRALTYIVQYCQDEPNANLIAETALEYAGMSVLDKDKANEKLADAVVEGNDE